MVNCVYISCTQAVERAKETISSLDAKQEGVVVEEMAVGGSSKVSQVLSLGQILSSCLYNLSDLEYLCKVWED